MTLRYAHLSPDHKKLALDVLSKGLVTNWSQNAVVGILAKAPLNRSPGILPITQCNKCDRCSSHCCLQKHVADNFSSA